MNFPPQFMGHTRPKTALALLSIAASTLSLTAIAPASAVESSVSQNSTITDQDILAGEYTSQEASHPAKDGGDGAEMGQVMKQAQQDQQSTLGRYSMTQAVTGVPTNGVPGMDVSSHQKTVDWTANYNKGARFAYIKATEGNYYTSPYFSSQYAGSAAAGIIRGAYHFAIPAETNGATQARYFVANGGGWSADGRTLPGLLDIEYNPYVGKYYGNTCYNMSTTAMTTWIRDFVNTYKSLTGRYPAVYSTTDWWRTCTGNTSEFNYLPLHIANYSGSSGTMPSGWADYDIWQFTDSGPFDGDSNVFNGSMNELRAMATSASYVPKGGLSPVRTQFFKDVSIYHQFYNEISWLASTGITTGWSDGTFRPSDQISREAMAAFMYRMAGSPAYTAPAVSPFKDVSTNHPYYKEISWLASRGITTGWSDGTFRPGDKISREAMAAFMYRLAGKPAVSGTSSFKDTSGSAFSKEIKWLVNNNITTGWSDGTFRPYDSVTREAMAAFIYRFTYRG